MYEALGCRALAGGFTSGIQQHREWSVGSQLEIGSLGRETVTRKLGVTVYGAGQWQSWPKLRCDMLFGRGHDLSEYVASLPTDDQPRILCWTVQPLDWASQRSASLLDELGSYDVAHLRVNLAAFEIAQGRDACFLVAYKRGARFNVVPPTLPTYRAVLRDAIEKLESIPATPREPEAVEYDADSWPRVSDEILLALETLKRGHELGSGYRRTSYDAPCSLLSSAGVALLVHPRLDRPFTVRELSAIMGWDFQPVGPDPIAQIVESGVPAVGTWLAEQARLYLDGAWGDEDFASRYDAKSGRFVEALRSEREKVFDLSEYRPRASRLDDWQDRPLSERSWIQR